MKKIKCFLFIISLAVFASCEKDNYPGPNAGLSGRFVDAETGEILHNKKLFHADAPEPLAQVGRQVLAEPVRQHQAAAAFEVRVDGGPWQAAQLSPEASQYSWKPFTFVWNGAAPGEHTIVSRVTDINGNVQLPQGALPERVSYWEEFGQFPRRVMVSA